MDELNIRISKKINQLQKQRNWSTYYLAKKANLNPSTLRSWTKGKSIPSVELLAKLCNAFDISLSEFFTENPIDIELTPKQKELLNKWMILDNSEKEAVLAIISTLNR